MVISRGIIGELMVQIPWANMLRENIIVKIKDLTILANLELLNIEEYRKESLVYIQRKILDRVESRIIDSFREAQKIETGYMGMFLDGLLKRIHFEIENVAIRFEIFDILEMQSALVLRLKKAYFNTDHQNVEDVEGKNLNSRILEIEGLGVNLERKNLALKSMKREEIQSLGID